MTHHPLTFGSIDAWHFTAADDSLATDAGRPAVVMAHGLAGTKDSGLEPFAEGLAAAGLDVLAFDYRGFGTSGGAPRQTVSVAGQVEDYRSALRAATDLPGVDPNRLVLWGESLAGGVVLLVAAGRTDIAAVVSMVPLVSGPAAALHALRGQPLSAWARSTARNLRRRPATVPVVARPGELGAMTASGYYEDYLAIAGPSWRNELAGSFAGELAPFRADRAVSALRAPWLVQVADFDRAAPPQAATRAAFRGHAQVRHYPCDHFDTQHGKPWHGLALAHQAEFLRRTLA